MCDIFWLEAGVLCIEEFVELVWDVFPGGREGASGRGRGEKMAHHLSCAPLQK